MHCRSRVVPVVLTYDVGRPAGLDPAKIKLGRDAASFFLGNCIARNQDSDSSVIKVNRAAIDLGNENECYYDPL